MEKRIRDPKDLDALREKTRAEIDLRNGLKDMTITVQMGTCGIASGARELLSTLASELSAASVDDVTVRNSGCLGRCDQEPMLTITTKAGEAFYYGLLDEGKIRRIVRQHVVGGEPVRELMIGK